MKFFIFLFYDIFFNIKFYKTALTIAIERGNKEIVDLLLKHPNIDIYLELIYILIFSSNFNQYILNYILK